MFFIEIFIKILEYYFHVFANYFISIIAKFCQHKRIQKMYISLSFPIRLFQYIHSIYRINLSVVTKLPYLSIHCSYFAYIIHHRLATFLLTAAYLCTTVMGGIETVVIIRNLRMFVNWLALSLFRRSTICDPINSWNCILPLWLLQY